jgi:hypothetical protein
MNNKQKADLREILMGALSTNSRLIADRDANAIMAEYGDRLMHVAENAQLTDDRMDPYRVASRLEYTDHITVLEQFEAPIAAYLEKLKALPMWIDVGSISVDAGLVWIGDPSYIMHKEGGEFDSLPKDLGDDWGDFCDKTFSKAEKNKLVGNVLATQFNHDRGHSGLGVCVSSGLGDGFYTVKAKLISEESFGKPIVRVAEIRVVFIEDKESNE